MEEVGWLGSESCSTVAEKGCHGGGAGTALRGVVTQRQRRGYAGLTVCQRAGGGAITQRLDLRFLQRCTLHGWVVERRRCARFVLEWVDAGGSN